METIVDAVIAEFALTQNGGIEVDAVVVEAAARLDPPSSPSMRDQRKAFARRALVSLCKGDDSPYVVEDGCIEVIG